MPEKLTQQIVEDRYKELGFKFLDTYINSKEYYKTLCKCGQEFKSQPNSVFTGGCKSCGHCNDPDIGDKINSLTIIGLKSVGKYGCRVQAKCDCGNITKWMPVCWLKNGSNKTCGKCNIPNIGDKFGKLTIIKIKPCKYGGGCSVKCICECGDETDFIHYDRLTSRHCTTCGNCCLMRNGRFTSNTALELHTMVEQILGKSCEHNFHIKGLGCVDIVNQELKIAIEYDGYYNHKIRNGDRTLKDQAKYRKLIAAGWKLLNIKSNGTDIPSENKIRKILLNHFQHDTKKYTITMSSWHNAKKKYG